MSFHMYCRKCGKFIGNTWDMNKFNDVLKISEIKHKPFCKFPKVKDFGKEYKNCKNPYKTEVGINLVGGFRLCQK